MELHLNPRVHGECALFLLFEIKKKVEGDGLKYSELLYNVCIKDYLVAFFCCDNQNIVRA